MADYSAERESEYFRAVRMGDPGLVATDPSGLAVGEDSPPPLEVATGQQIDGNSLQDIQAKIQGQGD